MLAGEPLYRARAVVGVSDATIRAWHRKARAGDSEAREFAYEYLLAKLAPKRRRPRPDQLHAQARCGLISRRAAVEELERRAVEERSVQAACVLLSHYSS